MKDFAGILVFVTILWQADAADPLKCRRCVGASSLDNCTVSIPCLAGEMCYMDEIITTALTIVYNGGCRVCTPFTGIGKRAASGPIIACTKCCDTVLSPECNTKLCGIKSSQPVIHQCYHCESLANPNACVNLVSCQSDKYCSADTYVMAGHYVYELGGCTTKGICKLLTTEALHRRKECEDDPSVCPTGIGRRETSGFRVCTACCGDSQCNGDSCEHVIDRLYNLWKHGVLDLDTLKQNGTLPTTTTSAPTL